MGVAEYDWEGFRSLAGRLDALLVDELSLSGDETFAEVARRTLAFLYAAGASMPPAGDVFEDAGGDEFWQRAMGANAAQADPAVAEREIEAIAQRLRADVAELQTDTDSEDYDEAVADAAAALWELREGLGAGMSSYDAKRLHEAAWEWSFGFDEWGGSALAASRALHELLWGAL